MKQYSVIILTLVIFILTFPTTLPKNVKFLEVHNPPTDSKQDSAWPMYGHDAQNTMQSQFRADTNQGNEKWKFLIGYHSQIDLQTPVIDDDGILYLTSDEGLFAIYPNGTQKWCQELDDFSGQQPAIGPDGIIYTATNQHLYSFYPNGTIQWELATQNEKFTSSPLVLPDGTIYIGTWDGSIYSIYPNGTIQWTSNLGYPITYLSSDFQGNIYVSAHLLYYLYSLCPNGTIRWSVKINDCLYDAPVIGPDGTIYAVANGDLIKYNNNGTLIWTYPDCSSSQSPALAPDGTLVVSPIHDSRVIAVNSINGHLKWTFDTGEYGYQNHKSRPAISSDGTIFISYSDFNSRSYLIALNPDGILRWKTRLTSDNHSGGSNSGTPSIGEEGIIYVTSTHNPNSSGFLHAIGACSPDAPTAPTLTGPVQGRTEVTYTFTIKSNSPTGKDLYYFIDWGDNNYDPEYWIGPYPSNQTITINHTWKTNNYYDVRAFAVDTDGLQGPRSEQRFTIIWTPTFLFGKIINLQQINDHAYSFEAVSVLFIQFSPSHIGLYDNQVQFIINHRPLRETKIIGGSLAVVPFIHE